MIPIRYFPLISQAARIMLRRREVEGERWVVDLLSRLRNAAANPDVGVNLRAEARRQHVEISGILERHRKVTAPDDGGPTPEAKAKRPVDAIGNLFRDRKISQAQVDAADDIAMAYGMVAGDVQAVGGFKYAPPTSQGRVKKRSAPEVTWTARRQRTWRAYKAWWTACEAEEMPMDAIMALIVEPVGLREVERRHSMTNGSLLAHLQAALTLYVKLAGWTVREEQPAKQKQTA